MSKPNAVAGQQGTPAQKHITDNLKSQLSVIMVQMGRIIKAQVPDQDRADFIVEHARKQMIEATDSFHSTLDEMEIEISRAKAVFLRDLELLRGKQQQQQQQQSTQPAAAPAHVAPPAPMVIDLDGFRPSGPAVPVAPMMATGGSPIVATHGVPKTEGKPVAPFPDMGVPVVPPQKPVSAVPFARVKSSPVAQKHPSPKQMKQPTPKQPHKPAPPKAPASAKMSNKPNPMAKPPRPPATAPPAAPAVAPAPMMAVAPAAPMAPVAAPQPQPPPPAPAPVTANAPHFTNATFTLDPPPNNDATMQPSGADSNLDMSIINMDTFGTEAGDASNNDTTMDDLDHFFDLGGDGSNADADPSEFNNNMEDYMNADFNFDDF